MASQNNRLSAAEAKRQQESREENMRRIALLKETMAAQQAAARTASYSRPSTSTTQSTASQTTSSSHPPVKQSCATSSQSSSTTSQLDWDNDDFWNKPFTIPASSGWKSPGARSGSSANSGTTHTSRPASSAQQATPSLRRSSAARPTGSTVSKPAQQKKSHRRKKEKPVYTLREQLLCWHYILFGIIGGLIWFTFMHNLILPMLGNNYEDIIDSDFVESMTGLFLTGYIFNCLITFIRFRGARIRTVLVQTVVLAVGGCAYMLLLKVGSWAVGKLMDALFPIIVVIVVVALILKPRSRIDSVQGSISRLREMEKDPEVSEQRKRAYARELAMAISSDKDMLGTDVDDINEIDSLYG